jgi:hypothetical protein
MVTRSGEDFHFIREGRKTDEGGGDAIDEQKEGKKQSETEIVFDLRTHLEFIFFSVYKRKKRKLFSPLLFLLSSRPRLSLPHPSPFPSPLPPITLLQDTRR